MKKPILSIDAPEPKRRYEPTALRPKSSRWALQDRIRHCRHWSELKSAYQRLQIEIYDAANKARVEPASLSIALPDNA
jgi:hypothetical protein